MRPSNLLDLDIDRRLWGILVADCLTMERMLQRGPPCTEVVPAFAEAMAEIVDTYLRDDSSGGVADVMLTAPRLEVRN
jgi:hypothetical protein